MLFLVVGIAGMAVSVFLTIPAYAIYITSGVLVGAEIVTCFYET